MVTWITVSKKAIHHEWIFDQHCNNRLEKFSIKPGATVELLLNASPFARDAVHRLLISFLNLHFALLLSQPLLHHRWQTTNENGSPSPKDPQIMRPSHQNARKITEERRGGTLHSRSARPRQMKRITQVQLRLVRKGTLEGDASGQKQVDLDFSLLSELAFVRSTWVAP